MYTTDAGRKLMEFIVYGGVGVLFSGIIFFLCVILPDLVEQQLKHWRQNKKERRHNQETAEQKVTHSETGEVIRDKQPVQVSDMAPKISEGAPLLTIEECGVLLHKRASESGVGTVKAIRQRDGVEVKFTCWLAGQYGGAHWKNGGPERFLPIPGVAPYVLDYEEKINGQVWYSSTVKQAIKEERYNKTDRFYLL